MKKLNYLKNLLNFIYYVSFLTILIMIVDYSKLLFNHNEILPINISGIEFTTNDTTTKIVIFFVVISTLLSVYTLSLLRKVILHFIKKEIFSEDVILLLNSIGKCLIAVSLIKGIPLLVYKFIFSPIIIEKNQTHFTPFQFSGIGLALFFMVLSEVFKMAKELKDENELTV